MIHEKIFTQYPYVKPDFANKFEVGRRFTCQPLGWPSQLIIEDGKKAMQIEIPWIYLIGDKLQFIIPGMTFDDGEPLAASTVDNNDNADNA